MTLGDTLRDAMRRAGVGTQTLSKLTGIPRTAIDNWREGMVRRPRHWRPLLQIARVLSLSCEQTDALLASAGYPVIAVLAADLPTDHPDRTHLVLWLAGTFRWHCASAGAYCTTIRRSRCRTTSPRWLTVGSGWPGCAIRTTRCSMSRPRSR